MSKVGERVGAIIGAKDGICEFLGYGVYEGDFVPNEAVGFMAKALVKGKCENPRIKLDNGKVVYGCECWWGGEEKIKEMLKRYEEVKTIDIDEYRKEAIKV